MYANFWSNLWRCFVGLGVYKGLGFKGLGFRCFVGFGGLRV